MKVHKLARQGLVAGLVLVGAGGLGACRQGDAPAPGGAEEAALAGEPESAPADAVALERFRRTLERGGDARAAVDGLEALLQKGTLGQADTDLAKLTLAAAHAALGDKEPAVVLLEELLAAHGNDRQWEPEEEANRLLAELLTGKSPPPSSNGARDTGTVAPFARALARQLELEEPGGRKDARPTLHLNALFFGGSEEVSTRLGTFNVIGAATELRRESCSLCPEGVRSDIHPSRSGSWLGIPRARAEADRALVVVYTDLEHNLVPARYEDLLPLPIAEVERRLAAGEGVYAAQKRSGAPPLVLVAAPRRGQIPDVEAALAEETALPVAPVAVELAPNLRPAEIQESVRGARPEQARCYEALLARAPGAEGRLTVSFAIEQGKPREVEVTTAGAGLDEATFVACMKGVFEGLTFPATPSRTTVTYPIEVSP
ncbi:MAG: AgmX/PglI C-terminal domain-containing protein [Polyangiaceae bacterium]|nr:AgmX/PglI C-terminal domain-containing protein [Polyangiaceae bacterium]